MPPRGGGSGNATQGGSTGTGGSSSGGGGGSVVSVPVCQLACGDVSECDLGTASSDPDNYACPDGYCVYAGCNSDAECQSMGNYVCR